MDKKFSGRAQIVSGKLLSEVGTRLPINDCSRNCGLRVFGAASCQFDELVDLPYPVTGKLEQPLCQEGLLLLIKRTVFFNQLVKSFAEQ